MSAQPTDLPDLPAGIASTGDPEAPLEVTAADVRAAQDLLSRAGEEPPAAVLTLTDEQILAVDGWQRPQFAAMPFAQAHPEQRALAAGIALRTLVAAGLVTTTTDARPRWLAAPVLAACLLLRRSAAVFTTLERTAAQVTRVHCCVHPAGVLEEEVTPAGLHRFTVLSPQQAAARLAVLLDPEGVAGEAGEPVTVATSALEGGHPLAPRIAATRSHSVLTSVNTADDTLTQITVLATDAEVLSLEALDGGADDPPLRQRALDPALVRALAAGVLRAPEADPSAPGPRPADPPTA